MTHSESPQYLKAVLWSGGDPPNRNAELTVNPTWDGFNSYWEPGYCGCDDCHLILGHGKTKAEAIADYWEQWEEKYA